MVSEILNVVKSFQKRLLNFSICQYYSCAVDCFLEISYLLFLPEIESNTSFNELSEFFNLLVVSGSNEIEVNKRNDLKSNLSQLLDSIREPIRAKPFC